MTAHNDPQLIEGWERRLPPEDQAVLAALAEADRQPDLGAWLPRHWTVTGTDPAGPASVDVQ